MATNLKVRTALMAGMKQEEAERLVHLYETVILVGSSEEDIEEKFWTWRFGFTGDLKYWAKSEWVDDNLIYRYAASAPLSTYEAMTKKQSRKRV